MSWWARGECLLLDVNALLALGWQEHEAHGAVVERLSAKAVAWASCAITQLGFVRISTASGVFSRTLTPEQAKAVLTALCGDRQHRFLAEMPSLVEHDFSQLQGERQATDAYLLALARHHGCTLLTLDRRLAAAFPGGAVELLST